jgi:hypothetical protein
VAQTAFFLKDLFDGNLAAGSGFTADLPGANASLDSPGLQAKQIEGTLTTGTFETGSSNKWIDINEGFGAVLTAVPSQQWTQGPDQIGAALEDALNAAASLTFVYTVTWLNGVFNIGAPSAFTILWDTGSHGTSGTDNNIGQELGFNTVADSSSSTSHTADKKRYSTGTSFVFDLGTATELNAFLWYAEGGDDDATVDFDDVVAYVDTNLRGFARDAWVDAASTTIALSTRSATQESNLIQIGFNDPDTAPSRRWAFVSWRHFDESADHRVGICKAFSVTWDTTNARTIDPLRGHQPFNGGQPRNVENYYPAPGLQRWRANLTFSDWETASWQEVVAAVINHGRRTGLLWVEDLDAVKANGAAAKLSAVDAGTALWSVVQSTSGGDATGQQDAYRSSSLSLEQLP